MTHKADLTIRTATHADLRALLHLYAETGLGSGQHIDLDRARALFERMCAYPDYRLYVVTQHDGPPIGTYVLLIMDNIAHGGRPLAVVEQVAVAHGKQGQGIGTLMMHHAMDEARAAGCYKLQLSSHTRFHDAHAFYDKLGFTRHGYSFYVDLE
jgi:GNAT superfamily N-acetyltransferase